MLILLPWVWQVRKEWGSRIYSQTQHHAYFITEDAETHDPQRYLYVGDLALNANMTCSLVINVCAKRPNLPWTDERCGLTTTIIYIYTHIYIEREQIYIYIYVCVCVQWSYGNNILRFLDEHVWSCYLKRHLSYVTFEVPTGCSTPLHLKWPTFGCRVCFAYLVYNRRNTCTAYIPLPRFTSQPRFWVYTLALCTPLLKPEPPKLYEYQKWKEKKDSGLHNRVVSTLGHGTEFRYI